MFNASLKFSFASSGVGYGCALYKNGVNVLEGDQDVFTFNGVYNATARVSGTLQLTANDYVQVVDHAVSNRPLVAGAGTFFQGHLHSAVQ